MKASVKKMQGTPAYIETHYEAMAYWKQEKKLCHYCKSATCRNENSVQYKKGCIGYTKCADFISDARFSQKKANEYKKEMKRKKNVKSSKTKVSDNAKGEGNNMLANNKVSENAIGNDPRFKAIFEQFQ